MKRFALVYNPVSGHATFKNRLDWIIEAFQKRGCMLLIYRTQKDNAGAFPEFLREAKVEGLLVAGGDGTLHEVVNLLLKTGQHLPVGIIGSGTSNDFASYLKINEDMDVYFDCIVAGKTRWVDLGRVGREYFVNVASAGMMTSIAHEVDVRLKNALGKMAYYLKGLGEIPKFRSMHIHLRADGRDYEIDAFLFVIINSAVVGSMRNVAAAAKVDDGKLDFLAVKKSSVTELMKITADLIAGNPVAEKNGVLHVQASDFLVSTEGKVQSDLDGEAGPLLPLHVETVGKALEVYCMDFDR